MYKKILIVRLDRIGDVMLSTPAISAVRKAFPGSHIAVMVSPYASPIIEGNPSVDEVIIYDKKGNEKGLSGNVRFAAVLGRKKFDLAIVLHPTARTHIALFLAGIPVRVGYDKKYGFLLTKRLPHTKQSGLKHEIDYTLDVLRLAGIEPSGRTLYMPIKKESELTAERIFTAAGIKKDDVVVALNPGASCPSKRWKAENFAKAAKAIIEKTAAKIVVVSGASDKACGDKTAALIGPGCLNLSGKTDISELASVLKRADVFISNDSGPVHIACALGTPVVAIFGRSDAGLSPRRWGPTGHRSAVLHKKAGCEICLAHNCKAGFKCLDAITVDEVVRTAQEMLKNG